MAISVESTIAFPGMRGTGDWQADQRPKSWRDMILMLFPNGDAPLTGILSRFGTEKVDDPQFYWWTKNLAQQGGVVTAVYTDSALGSAYTSGAVAGTVLYVKCSAETAGHFRARHEVLFRRAANGSVNTDFRLDTVGECVSSYINGANSYIAVRLLEADDNGVGLTLADATWVQVIGSIHPEGGEMPSPIAYDPEKFFNYTQIYRNSLEMTRTAQATRLRTGAAKAQAKKEALQYHSIDIERSFLFGIRTETTDENGKPKRTSFGVLPFMRAYAPNNVVDYVTSGIGSWETGGENWLDQVLEPAYRYGSTSKLGLCGSGALIGIKQMAKSGATVNLNQGASFYGMNIRRLEMTFGDLMLKTHPLFNIDPALRNSILILEPQYLKQRVIDNTFFKADDRERKGGSGQLDGSREEFLTEIGLEIHYPQTMAFLSNVGVDAA